MFQKQLDLIIAALLPMCILAIGFFAFRAIAGLNPDETADPEGCGAYYRTLFGSEITSDILCPAEEPDIVKTVEDAEFSLGAVDYVDWSRDQEWRFEDTMSWNTNYCYIYLDKSIWWSNIGDGDGYWNGTEQHVRNYDAIEVQTNIYRWMAPNNDIRCPKYRQYGGYSEPYIYCCDDPENPDWPSDWFDETISYSANPEPHGVGDETQNWYNCVAID